MSLRFTSQLMIDNLPDEQITDQFEVIMPELNIIPDDDTNIIDYENGKVPVGETGWFSGYMYKYRPIVENIQFGLMNFKTDTRRVRTGWYNVPSDIESYHDLKITMFCSAAMTTQHYLDAWKALIFNKRGEYYYPGNNYKKNIDVFIFSSGGSGISGSAIPKTHYTLQGCFPYLQDDYQFEYTDDPKRFTITATFKVDNIVKDKNSAKATAITELVTSPTSMLDKAISKLSSSGEYSIESTYGGASQSSILGKLF